MLIFLCLIIIRGINIDRNETLSVSPKKNSVIQLLLLLGKQIQLWEARVVY